MANKKITDLVPVAAAAMPDLYETVQGGVTGQTSNQKIADLLGLGSGKIVLNNGTGAASFGAGQFFIQPSGAVNAANWNITAAGQAQFAAAGSFGAGAIVLNIDGSAAFGGVTGFAIDSNGNIRDGLGVAWNIRTDGSTTFSNGAIAFDASGVSATFANGLFAFDVAGRASTYANDVTAGNGLSSIVASVALTNQAAAIGVTNLFTPPVNGTYRVSVVQQVTTSSAAGLLTTTIGWTDLVGATTAVPAAALATTATGRDDGAKTIFATAGVPITYTTTLTNITTQRYALNIIVERLS